MTKEQMKELEKEEKELEFDGFLLRHPTLMGINDLIHSRDTKQKHRELLEQVRDKIEKDIREEYEEESKKTKQLLQDCWHKNCWRK